MNPVRANMQALLEGRPLGNVAAFIHNASLDTMKGQVLKLKRALKKQPNGDFQYALKHIQREVARREKASKDWASAITPEGQKLINDLLGVKSSR